MVPFPGNMPTSGRFVQTSPARGRRRGPRCYARAVRAALPTALLLAALAPAPAGRAHAQGGDFAPAGGAWNSVSELVQIARAREIEIVTPDRMDVGTLRPNDSLLILHPRAELPANALTRFLRAGGRVALADDFGAGDSLLSVFQIGRGAPDTELAMKLRGNPALLVARPRAEHRLTRGVRALVGNHPAAVHHRDLSPIFALGEGEAMVLAGAVGQGRLVVISDPSALIDNMLELRGNRRFAENLVEYLDADRGGRLHVVGPDVPVVGRWGEPGAGRPLHDLRASLEALAELDLPPAAVRVATLALAAIAVIMAVGVLPRRSPYRSARMFARPPAQGGFVGRVGFFGRRKTNLLHPLMVYKFELEEEILARLNLHGRALLRDVLDAMRRRGLGEEDLSAMRRLLLELDRLREQADRPPAPPRVGPKRFRELVAAGERLLSRLGGDPDREAA